MPKIGMEAERRKSLIFATISAIHEDGFRELTMAHIAKKAGVSTGLAHHYFGSKEHLLAATMRHLLKQLSDNVREQLAAAETPRGRISAIIKASFAPEQFQDAIVTTWLSFYIQAQTNTESKRLLKVYSQRLVSNLTFGLKAFMPTAEARHVAEGTASMIDGVWLRRTLHDANPDARAAIRTVEDYVDLQLRKQRNDRSPPTR